MSRHPIRDLAPRDTDSVEHQLARIVPDLEPETLHRIIRHRGLDACGEIVASATPAQLTAVLDLDLWRHTQPGRDESFDVDRFGDWLEALVEAGHSVAARTVAALDKDLVILGLSRYVRVFDRGIFEPTAQSDDESTDRGEAMHEGDAMDDGDAQRRDVSDDSIECEIAGYLVRARRTDAWDAIVTLLVTLETEYDDDFHAIMRGSRLLSNSRPEIDGLDDRLQAPEQHLHEVAIDREHRRSQQGYATPADARAFLHMAREPQRTQSGTPPAGATDLNPIVAAYFRATDDAPVAHARDVSASSRAAIELVAESGVIAERPRALLDAADADTATDRLTHLRRLMADVRETDEHIFRTRGRELAFLANTMRAGGSVQSRPFTNQEASDAAASICNLGLECGEFPSDSLLTDHGLIEAFEVGWSVLYRDVSMFVADRIIATLADFRCADRDIQRGLVEWRRVLVKQRDAGTPWLARGAADVLAMIDVTAWTSVVGLLDECPILPAALTAIVEGRTTTISPTAFAFISTTAQIGDVRIFMRMLPRLLS